MQESQTPQGSGVGRSGVPISVRQFRAMANDARDGGFADAAMAGEDVAVRDAVLGEGVQQGARDVVLAGHVGKALRTIFSGQNLITHGCTRSFGTRLHEGCLGGIVSFPTGARWGGEKPGDK